MLSFRILLVFFFLSILNACEDRAFYKQGLEIAKFTSYILVKEKICDSIESCTGDHFFISPERQGVNIMLYEFSGSAINQVVTKCRDVFFETKGINIYVYIYEEPFYKVNNYPLFWFEKKYSSKIAFTRGKNNSKDKDDY